MLRLDRPGRRGPVGAAAALLIAVAPAGAEPRVRGEAQSYALSLVDADIASVADQVLGQTLRIPYTIDPGVTGKITLRVERRLTREQLLGVFEQALAQNGAALVQTAQGTMAIVPRAKANSVRSVELARSRTGAGYHEVAVTLRFAVPSEVAKVLAATGAGDVVLHTDDRLGLIVLGGTSEEVNAARQTLALFDRSRLSASRVRIVGLQAASPDAVAGDLERLVKAADLGGAAIVPMQQLNAVVLLARSPALLDELQDWVLRLDRPPTNEPTTLWIYRPNNVPAESLAEALRALTTTQSKTTVPGAAVAPTSKTSPEAMAAAAGALQPYQAGEPQTQVSAGDVTTEFNSDILRVSVERTTNSLLVMAPASRWRSLKTALDQLDRPPDQILIEATVLEVTLNRDFRFGVDWSYVGKNGKVSVTQSQFQNGAVRPVYPGISLTYLNGGVTAVVDALSERTDVEVVSAPKLMALNNQSASLQVGDQVPVIVQQAQGTAAAGAPLVVSTDYRDTGVILKIKPRINGEHSVLLDLSQEVSNVAPTITSGIDSPTIQQRKFDSSLQIEEGETIALGGLISSRRSKGDVGVPLFSRIPIAGSIFKTSTRSGARTELIVLLSARIIRAGQAHPDQAEGLKEEMGEIRKRELRQSR